MSEVVATRYAASGRPMRDLAREREASAEGVEAKEPVATA
jgi:hypothetical protein